MLRQVLQKFLFKSSFTKITETLKESRHNGKAFKFASNRKKMKNYKRKIATDIYLRFIIEAIEQLLSSPLTISLKNCFTIDKNNTHGV